MGELECEVGVFHVHFNYCTITLIPTLVHTDINVLGIDILGVRIIGMNITGCYVLDILAIFVSYR